MASSRMRVRVREWCGAVRTLVWYLGPLFTSVGYTMYFVLCRVVPVACVCDVDLVWRLERSQVTLTHPLHISNPSNSIIQTETLPTERSESVLRRSKVYFESR